MEEEEIKNRSFNSPSTLRHAQSTSQLKSVSINPAHTVPSKVFQYVDRKYSITEDETNQANYVSNRKQSFSEEQFQRSKLRILFFEKIKGPFCNDFIYSLSAR